MSAFLYRLGRISARHPFRVLATWVVAAIAIVALQGAAGGQFDNSERVPGVESQHAADVLNDRFPSQGGLSARIVLHTDEGRLDDPAMAATVEQARAELAGGADVAGVSDPFATGTAAVSADGQTAYLDVSYAVDKLTTSQLDDALAVRDAARDGGVQVELTGDLALLAQETPSSELIGVGVAIIVLLLAFGSVVAMGLPIGTALMGIFVGAATHEQCRARYDQITWFERMLCEEGTRVVKVFLHLSKDEQRQRLEERLADPTKNWKFRPEDLTVRKQWDEYMDAYEEVLGATSSHHAPWHVVPADRKWVRDVAVATLLLEVFREMDPRIPPPDPDLASIRVDDD